MENDKRTYLTWRHKATALLFLTVMTLQLFRVTDKWQISWLLLIAGWMGLRPLPFKRWSTIDKVLIIITIRNLLSLTYTAVHIAGLHMLRYQCHLW